MSLERAATRNMYLALRRGDTATAERHARSLAEVRGAPDTWRAAYDAQAARLGANRGRGLAKPSSQAVRAVVSTTHGMAAFYDRHPRKLIAVTMAASAKGGFYVNRRFGPLTPFELQPSTFAALAFLGAGVLARRHGYRRTGALAMASAAGQVIATVEAHVPEGGLIARSDRPRVGPAFVTVEAQRGPRP